MGAERDHEEPCRRSRHVERVWDAARERGQRSRPATASHIATRQRHLPVEDVDELVPRVTVQWHRLRVAARVLDDGDRVAGVGDDAQEHGVATRTRERLAGPGRLDVGHEAVARRIGHSR